MLFRTNALIPTRSGNPFSMLRQLRAEMDQFFTDPFWPTLQYPGFESKERELQPITWTPMIEVFEKNNRLVTRVDLPGLKKEDVKVEFADGRLVISGERKREFEETKENLFRSEREYGTFYRSVLLPEGVKFEDVKATFVDGVLEVSVPIPVLQEPAVRRVDVQVPEKAVKSAA